MLEGGVTMGAAQLRNACQGRLENFMVPKHIAFVASLPRTDSGKITKTGLT